MRFVSVRSRVRSPQGLHLCDYHDDTNVWSNLSEDCTHMHSFHWRKKHCWRHWKPYGSWTPKKHNHNFNDSAWIRWTTNGAECLYLLAYINYKQYDPPRTRTWNLRLRRPTPYPLGQRAIVLKYMGQWQVEVVPLWIENNIRCSSVCAIDVFFGPWQQIIPAYEIN